MKACSRTSIHRNRNVEAIANLTASPEQEVKVTAHMFLRKSELERN